MRTRYLKGRLAEQEESMSKIINVAALQKKAYETPEQNMASVRQMLDAYDGNLCTGPKIDFLVLPEIWEELLTDFFRSWRVTGGCMWSEALFLNWRKESFIIHLMCLTEAEP